MDLMPENPIQPKKEKNNKVIVALVFVIVLIILLVVAAVFVWMYSQSLKEKAFKVIIDGVQNAKASSNDGIFLIRDGKVYTSIEDICSFVGYTFYRGGYRQYTEDKTKCYVNNSKEIVSFASGSKELIKYSTDANDLPQNFVIDEEIIVQQGEKLYLSEQGLERAFNLMLSYNEENNTINISTLSYLTAYYEKTITNASIDKSSFADDIKFNNAKALLRNLIIIQDPNTKLYGVGILNSSKELSTVITQRYTEIEYIEGSDDFIVTTEGKKVGIIGSDGITKVKPDYDTIEVIDKNVGLYLVSNSSKQSVININGKIIVHQDYDQIGLDVNSYDDPVVTNRYLLLENCIPVKLNNKWGLIDKNGEAIVPVQYDGIGCAQVQNAEAKNTFGITVVPDINGIVVEVDSEMQSQQNTKIKRYGILSAKTGELIVNTVLDSVYSVTTEGITKYYMSAGNQVFDINEWANEQNPNYANENQTEIENAVQNTTYETNQITGDETSQETTNETSLETVDETNPETTDETNQYTGGEMEQMPIDIQ